MADFRPKNEAEIEIPFPSEGIDVTSRFSSQRGGTTIEAINVRVFDHRAGRERGAQRPGLFHYFSGQAVTSTGPGGVASTVVHPIQCIDHLNSTELGTPVTFGRFVFAQAAAAGFGIATGSTGNAVFSGLGAAADFQFANSCWDSDGNLYVADVNQTTGAVNIRRINSSGSIEWTQTTLTCATGTDRNVPGMVSIGDFLFVGLTLVKDSSYRITKLQKTTGAIAFQAWKQTAAGYAMYFSNNAQNCLCAVGNNIIIESAYTSPVIFGALAVGAGSDDPGGYNMVYAYAGATLSHARTKVVTDGSAVYVIASTTTNQLKKIGLNSTLIWESTQTGINALTYDKSTNQLIIACSAAPYIRKIDPSDGSLLSSAVAASVAWDEIDCDGQGTFIVWKDGQSSNDVMGLSSSLGTLWGPSTLANADHRGASVNKGTDPTIPVVGPRLVRSLGIAGGTAFRFTEDGPVSLTGGRSFNAVAPVIFSAQNGANMYFVDRSGYFYYKASTDSILAWTATPPGEMPFDTPIERAASLIATYRERTILAGFSDNSWYASKRGDPHNWDYDPETASEDDATNGVASPAGVPGDGGPITCIFVYNDDTMVFGLDHSIWLLSGDPSVNGQFDMISDAIGIVWGRPFAKDPHGQVFFMANTGSIFKMTPGVVPIRVSQKIDKKLENIDLGANVIRMAWDVQRRGMWVFVTPIAGKTPTTNFFFSEKNESWVTDKHLHIGHQPFAVHVSDGDLAEDRTIFLGGRDGRVRYISDLADDDDGYPINSEVWLGPISTKQQDDIMLCTLRAILSADSGDVTYEVYVGDTVEEARASSRVAWGTWSASKNTINPIERSGFAIFIRIVGVSPWAIEMVRATYKVLGPSRRKW